MQESVQSLDLNGRKLLILHCKNADADRLQIPEFIKEKDKEYFDYFLHFLQMPYIIDDFDNHEERRKWRHSLPQNEREHYDNNKLRLNHVGGMMQAVEFFYFYIPK